MRKIRNITNAVAEIKKADKDTALNDHMLRYWIKIGAIPAIRSGRRLFVDMDTLEEYLANPGNTTILSENSRRINL